MKCFFFLVLNLATTLVVYYYLYDPTKEQDQVTVPLLCLKFEEDSKQLCVQCVKNTTAVNSAKGYTLQSSTQYSILKFPYGQAPLTCQQSLHLINYNNALKKSIHIEKMQAIKQIISQLDGELTPSTTGRAMVQSNVGSFLVYSWHNINQKSGVGISVPNENYIIAILQFFFNAVNAAVVIFLLRMMLTGVQGVQGGISGLSLMICFTIVALEIATSKYTRPYENLGLYCSRVGMMIVCLVRLRLGITAGIIFALIGFALATQPLHLAIYTVLGWLLIVFNGLKATNGPIWLYVLAAQLINAANYTIWHLYFQGEADTQCRIIEFSQMILNLLVFVFLKDAKADEPAETSQGPMKLKDYDDQFDEVEGI